MHCSRCSETFDCANVYVWAEFHNNVNFGLATLCEACWQEVQMGLRALFTPHAHAFPPPAEREASVAIER